MKKIAAPKEYSSGERPRAVFICKEAKPTLTRSRYATRYSRHRNGIKRRRTRRMVRASSSVSVVGGWLALASVTRCLLDLRPTPLIPAEDAKILAHTVDWSLAQPCDVPGMCTRAR